ncbi:hypothetical protein BKA70DRAFT_1217487 [Coprinopsis sp. MPI-PUGE-AT-0042]|nr:hypothetical protein BKA70DRAFT_1217487 [Coprinopsis sp. MPI-PUGE-AT-0042]
MAHRYALSFGIKECLRLERLHAGTRQRIRFNVNRKPVNRCSPGNPGAIYEEGKEASTDRAVTLNSLSKRPVNTGLPSASCNLHSSQENLKENEGSNYVQKMGRQLFINIHLHMRGDMPFRRHNHMSYVPGHGGPTWLVARALPEIEVNESTCMGKLSFMLPDGPTGKHKRSSQKKLWKQSRLLRAVQKEHEARIKSAAADL